MIEESTVVVEFSISQKAIHKCTAREMIENNIRNILERRQTDYLPIGFFDTMEDAEKFVKNLYKKLKDYSMYRTTSGETIIT